MFKEIVDPNFTWKNFTVEEQSKILESDRSNNYLDTTRLTSLYPNVKNIKSSIRDCLYKYNDTYNLNVKLNNANANANDNNNVNDNANANDNIKCLFCNWWRRFYWF